MLLKQGLMFSPRSQKTASSRTRKIKTREFKEGKCCKGKALLSNPKRKMTLGVDNLGLGHLLLLDFWKVRLAQGEEEMRV